MEQIRALSPTRLHINNVNKNKQKVFDIVSKGLQKAYTDFFIKFKKFPLNHKEIVTQFIVSQFHNDKEKRKLIEIAQSEGNDGFLSLLNQHVSIEDCNKIVLNQEGKLPYFGKTNTYSELILMVSEKTFIEHIINNAEDLAMTIKHNFIVETKQSETKLQREIALKAITKTELEIKKDVTFEAIAKTCALIVIEGGFISNFIEHAKYCVKDVLYNYIDLYSQELDYKPLNLEQNFNKHFECNQAFQINFNKIFISMLDKTNLINKNKGCIDYCVGIVTFCDEIMSSEIFISEIEREIFNLYGLSGSHRFLRLMALDKEISYYTQNGIKTLVSEDLRKLQVYDQRGNLSEVKEYNNYGHLQAIIEVEHAIAIPFDVDTSSPDSEIWNNPLFIKTLGQEGLEAAKKFATRSVKKEEPK